MPRKYSQVYIDKLIAKSEYSGLVELSTAICSWQGFATADPMYGFPMPIFAYIECLFWIAQSVRSGAWTYYEATSETRQAAMSCALDTLAPAEFAAVYIRGMRDWRDEAAIAYVDAWIATREEAVNKWLQQLITDNRETIYQLTA